VLPILLGVLVESDPGGRPADEPPASEVVRGRLLQLIRDLQQAGPPAGQPAGPRHALPDDEAEEEAGEAADGSGEPEDWLDRLRHPAVPEPPQPVAPAGAPLRPWLKQAAGRAVEFGREHLAAVVVVLLVGVAWSAYSILQARSSPVAAAAPVIQASPSASPQAPGSPAARVVVHVIGAVREPGVVELPEGSRVADAITAAGGLTESAAPGELNLAQVLGDGVQLKVGTRKHPGGWIRDGTGAAADPGSTVGAAGEQAKVSLNSATLAQLDTLPGVGPVTAQKILDWRKEHGKFTAITELQEVDGIGPKTYANLEAHVRL
jgi:competence protein ComEA